MTDNIFDQEPTSEEETSNTQSSETRTLFDEFVGEGKRFKSPQELLKSKFEGDKHIKNVEKENADLRKEVDDLRALVKDSFTDSGNPKGSKQEPPAKELTDEEIDARVERSLNRSSKAKVAKDNIASVEVAVIEAQGDREKAKTFIHTKAKELGMTVNDLLGLAATSPTTFYRAVGMEQVNASTTTGVLPTNVRNAEARPPKILEKSWAWYQELKKSNPKVYWDSKTQLQLIKDAENMGQDAFFGRTG